MRRVILIVVTLMALLVLGVAGSAAVLYFRALEPYRSYSANEQFVEIAPGTSIARIGDQLVRAGVVRDTMVFRVAFWVAGENRPMKAGEYRFDRPIAPLDVVRMLVRGDVYLRVITFPEGLRIDEMARLFEQHGFGPADSFLQAARNTDPIVAIDVEATDLEGYLFPDTYKLPRSTNAGDLVRMMVQRFEQTFGPDLRKEAEARKLDVRQVVTLASIVEKETGRAAERPLVAAVYTNRLKLRMGLQSDPTVIYALLRAGRYTGDLTREDLAFDSPYNTYRFAGLPPGPIASPGARSLTAAVRPADVPYLYFVSRNDGSHQFATSLPEHNRNVLQFQVLPARERRLQAAALRSKTLAVDSREAPPAKVTRAPADPGKTPQAKPKPRRRRR
ncbi:MAG: endolytic transglycosylase MltG [Acidobacteria bacterium]|nr:endolytic transglycosylase MltG [Acidobacteriota bacterium]